jgi:hypothetical protein
VSIAFHAIGLVVAMPFAGAAGRRVLRHVRRPPAPTPRRSFDDLLVDADVPADVKASAWAYVATWVDEERLRAEAHRSHARVAAFFALWRDIAMVSLTPGTKEQRRAGRQRLGHRFRSEVTGDDAAWDGNPVARPARDAGPSAA